MNKKGDLPTILVLFVALFAVGATLYVFITFDERLRDSTGDYLSLMSETKMYQKILENVASLVFLESQSKEEFISEIEKEENTLIMGTNFFGRVRNGDFELKNNKLIIEDVYILSEKNYNKYTRNFDICLNLDENGKVVSCSALT